MNDWFEVDVLRAWMPELKAALRILTILAVAWAAQVVVSPRPTA